MLCIFLLKKMLGVEMTNLRSFKVYAVLVQNAKLQ